MNQHLLSNECNESPNDRLLFFCQKYLFLGHDQSSVTFNFSVFFLEYLTSVENSKRIFS